MVSNSCHDLRLALRELRRSTSFVITVVGTLSVGLAFNIVLFSMLNAVRHPELPYSDADRIVSITQTYPPYGWTLEQLSLASFRDITAETVSFEAVAAYTQRRLSVTGPRTGTRVPAAVISSHLWSVLGLPPIAGRGFTSEEDQPGAPATVMIGQRLAADLFGAQEPIVGRSITVEGVDRVVVGVMPAGFHFPEAEHLWLPLGWVAEADSEAFNRRSVRAWDVVAKLAPNVTLSMASEDLARLGQQLADRFPEAHRSWHFTPIPVREVSFVATGRFFTALQVLGLLVVLIMCGNLGNLLLARSHKRRRELAIYVALGASRSRLFRLLVGQVGICAAAALIVAFIMAMWAIDLVPHAIPESIPFFIRFRIDTTVVLFGVVLAAAAALVAGLGTAHRATRGEPQRLLAGGSGALVSAPREGRLQSTFLFVQAVLASALLASALGVGFNLLRFNQMDLGFDPSETVLVGVPLPSTTYSDPVRTQAFVSEVVGRLERLPDIRSLGLSAPIGMSRPSPSSGAIDVDRPLDGGVPVDAYVAVTGGYFRAMGMTLLGGRLFSDADTSGSEPVVVINREAARRLFGTADAEGRTMRFGRHAEGRQWRTIIGVVENTIEQPLDPEIEPRVYVPFEQDPGANLTLIARTAGQPAAIGSIILRVIREVDPSLATETPTTWNERLSLALWPVRFFSGFAAAASLCGLIVACSGVYGLTRYLAVARTREIALRIALGADGKTMMWMVARQTAPPVLAGLAIGLLCSVAVSKLLQHILVGSPAFDPAAFVVSLGVLATAAGWAIGSPTLAATRIAPAEGLRNT